MQLQGYKEKLSPFLKVKKLFLFLSPFVWCIWMVMVRMEVRFHWSPGAAKTAKYITLNVQTFTIRVTFKGKKYIWKKPR